MNNVFELSPLLIILTDYRSPSWKFALIISILWRMGYLEFENSNSDSLIRSPWRFCFWNSSDSRYTFDKNWDCRYFNVELNSTVCKLMILNIFQQKQIHCCKNITNFQSEREIWAGIILGLTQALLKNSIPAQIVVLGNWKYFWKGD